MRKFLLVCGILASLIYGAMNAFVPMLYQGYSLSAHTVSELSAIGAPTRTLWIVLGLVYTVFIVAFGVGVWMSAEGSRALRIAGSLLIAHGVIAIFWPPMHQRGVEPGLTDTLHIVWTGVMGLLFMLVILFGALAQGTRFRMYSALTVIVMLVFGGLTGMESPAVATNLPTPWIGVWERINIAAYLLWVIVFAVVLLRGRAASRATRTKFSEIRIAYDMWRAQRQGEAGLAARRERRLEKLFRYARAHSPFYQNLYHDLPDDAALSDLPPVNKRQLMAAFDDWVTDRRITRADVEAFVADPEKFGTLYRDEYFACTSSGTTGYPGLFLHDQHALAVYRAIVRIRIDLAWLGLSDMLRLATRGLRWASIVGTGGHFGGAGWVELERHSSPRKARAYRVLSAQRPLGDLVAELNDFDPTIVAAYPSALELLAGEQEAGRLHLRPILTEIMGESVRPESVARMADALGCKIRNTYGASEVMFVAMSCDHGWLHVCSDWIILEPVDEQFQPVPPGEPSYTVLITNLANRIQPIIRYDLGDSIVVRPDRCPCGSHLPAIRAAGRCDDVLRLRTRDARPVSVLPLAIGSVMEEAPGVRRSQLTQTGPESLELRLEAEEGVELEPLWRAVMENLRGYLSTLGLGNVEVVRANEPPRQSARSGKFRQVIGL